MITKGNNNMQYVKFGKREEKCPQSLEIIKGLKDVRKLLG